MTDSINYSVGLKYRTSVAVRLLMELCAHVLVPNPAEYDSKSSNLSGPESQSGAIAPQFWQNKRIRVTFS